MCVQAQAELEGRIVRALPESGRVQAFDLFQRLGDDGTCLKHYCDAMRSLIGFLTDQCCRGIEAVPNPSCAPVALARTRGEAR